MDSHTPSTATTPATSSTPPEGSPRPARRVRRELRFWTFFGSSAVCAILIPIVVVAVAQLTDDGPARMLLTWLIAMLMGLAVYSSAAATHAARRMRLARSAALPPATHHHSKG